MAGIEDTQPIDNSIVVLKDRVPEPAVIRGAVVAVVALVGAVLGKTYDVSWLEPALAAYAVVAPAVLSWWIRRNVSPVQSASGRHAKP